MGCLGRGWVWPPAQWILGESRNGMMGKHKWKCISVSLANAIFSVYPPLVCHLLFLPTSSHSLPPWHLHKKGPARTQQGVYILSNALYASQIHIKIRHMNIARNNLTIACKKKTFMVQSHHLRYITPRHLKEPLSQPKKKGFALI